MLVGPGHIGETDFESAAKEAKDADKDLQDVLVEKGLIKDEQLGQSIADSLGLKFINLKNVKIDEEVLNIIPELVSRSKGVIAISRTDNEFINPIPIQVAGRLERRPGVEPGRTFFR